jgi:hypothetical protein
MLMKTYRLIEDSVYIKLVAYNFNVSHRCRAYNCWVTVINIGRAKEKIRMNAILLFFIQQI